MSIRSLCVPVFLLVLAACAGDQASSDAPVADAPPATQDQMPPGHPPATAAPTDAQQPVGRTGKALEVLEGGGYTYVKMEIGSSEVWIAGPQTAVKVGDTVHAAQGAPMENFRSPSLNRTFDRIDFVASIGVGDAAPSTATATPSAKPGADVEVEKLADGQTVAEIWAGKDAFGGKEVAIRGKVVKYNPGIMKTNFLHLQDGSGDPVAATHDLTVTSTDPVAVGDVVVARGKLVLNRDFGMGYKYEILLEDAKITAE